MERWRGKQLIGRGGRVSRPASYLFRQYLRCDVCCDEVMSEPRIMQNLDQHYPVEFRLPKVSIWSRSHLCEISPKDDAHANLQWWNDRCWGNTALPYTTSPSPSSCSQKRSTWLFFLRVKIALKEHRFRTIQAVQDTTTANLNRITCSKQTCIRSFRIDNLLL